MIVLILPCPIEKKLMKLRLWPTFYVSMIHSVVKNVIQNIYQVYFPPMMDILGLRFLVYTYVVQYN